MATEEIRATVHVLPSCARVSCRRHMIKLAPITLEAQGVRLEPLAHDHSDGITRAASDGKLWELWYTAVPKSDEVTKYIDTALEGQRAGHMLPWAVRELSSNQIVGSTRYHDIMASID